MKSKPIKLSPKKGGNGYISSYTINIGVAEAKECGLLDEAGNPLPLVKTIDVENRCVIISLDKLCHP